MREYHKIQTIFKREEHGKRRVIEGQYSLPEFEYLKDNSWVFTEKVDGTNIRIMWDGSNVTFGGKTDNAQMPVFLLYRLQELFEKDGRIELFREVFKDMDGGVCLYGEGYGAKIQKGGGCYIRDGVDFVMFDVRIGDWWLERHNVEEIAGKFGLRVVPKIGIGTLADAVKIAKDGLRSTWGGFQAEGLVLRPTVELKTRRGDRIITKIKCKDFDTLPTLGKP
jgi:hypothetical protein